MEVIPAIDFKDGKVVNLKQGQLERSTTYSDDPVAMADQWVAQGCQRLHLVDLDGAFAGKPVNAPAIKAIAARHPSLTIQLGGGIRSEEVIAAYLQAGVDYLIVGTKAVQQPEFVGQMCQRFPGHIIVGLDGLDGKVAINGWKQVTDVSVVALAQRFAGDGVAAIVYTDIHRDGMMQGVNLAATEALADAVALPIIASGGVTDMADLHALLALNGKVAGVITGRAIYEGTLDLAEAFKLTRQAAS